MAKYSWIVLLIIGVLLMVSAAFVFSVEVDENEFLADTGQEWSAFKSEQPEVANYIARLIKLLGVGGTGFIFFGVIVAFKPYRNRERWAWFAMLLYPIVFGGYAAVFVGFGVQFLGIYYGVVAGIALLALIIGYPNFSLKA
jgi:hypothetical protein